MTRIVVNPESLTNANGPTSRTTSPRTRRSRSLSINRRLSLSPAAELSPASNSNAPLETAFVIVIDTAEKQEYTFTNLYADAAQLHRPMVVRTERKHITIPNSGKPPLSVDYSLSGFETTVAIERKSHEDFCNTLAGKHRGRFERKLAILNGDPAYHHVVVVVEAEWSTILNHPPDFSNAAPKSLFRTVIAWQTRYPKVHWLMMPNRERAEQATFRILERWWKELSKPKPKPSASHPLPVTLSDHHPLPQP